MTAVLVLLIYGAVNEVLLRPKQRALPSLGGRPGLGLVVTVFETLYKESLKAWRQNAEGQGNRSGLIGHLAP
jgi:hypothetical protein